MKLRPAMIGAPQPVMVREAPILRESNQLDREASITRRFAMPSDQCHQR
jgi:hypothetical protein